MAGRGDFDLAAGGVRVRVTGLRELVRSAERAGVQAADMRAAMAQVADLVVTAARPLARHHSGAMAGTIRPTRAKNRAAVRAGGAAVPYAGAQHYGWPAHGIEPNPFLTEALQQQRPEVLAELDRQLTELMARAGL